MMMSRLLSAAILGLGCLTGANGFSRLSSPAFHSDSRGSKNVLHISSWGTEGPPSRSGSTLERENPEEKIQAYLKEAEAVEARNNVDGKCMVSGLVNAKDRTDQTLFDFLNHEDSAFEFDKLVAFVDDVVFAKKRLFSRSARYTGLMDKLEFSEASSAGALPTVEQLEGIKSWIAVLEAGDGASSNEVLDTVETVASLAKQASDLENIAVLVTNGIGLDLTKSKQVLDAFKADTALCYTLVVVGKLEEKADGSVPYQFKNFTTEEAVLKEDAVFSRDESLRMISELLQLESGVNKAFAFTEVYDVNATEAKLIKGLREAGYARMQEIDHMVNDGPQKYRDYIDEWKTKNPDWQKGYTSDAWWEDEQFQKSVKERAVKDEAEEQRIKDARTEEIEKIAKEWAKREFFRQSMSGAIVTTTGAEGATSEEEYIKSIWDRAMFEGDMKYRQLKGEIVNEQDEYADFRKKQERKQQIMLQRAKDELAEMLDEENLGGDDIRQLVTSDEDDDDVDVGKSL